MRTPMVFDTYGTLLDETGSLRREASAVLGDDDGPAFADDWDARTSVANRDARLGRREWTGSENLRRSVLSELLTEGEFDHVIASVTDLVEIAGG